MSTTSDPARPAAKPKTAVRPEPATPPSPMAGLMERIHPLNSVRKHKLAALILFIAIVGLGIPVALIKGKPVYFSEAVVYVSPRFLKNLQDDKEHELESNSQYREYVQQNVRTINRYDIVEDALKASPEFRQVWKRPTESDRRSVERLQTALMIQPVTDTYQITVGLESDSQAGLASFLNTLVAIYLRKAKNDEFYASDARLASLSKEAQELTASIDANQEQRTDLAQQLGVSTFTENYINPYDRLLVSAKEALAEGRRKRIDAEAAVSSMEARAVAGKRRNVDAYALELASRDAAVTTAIASLNNRRADLIGKVSGLAERHPGRLAAQQEIAEIDAEKQKIQDRLAGTYSDVLLDQKRAEAKRAKQVETELAKEVDQQQSQAAWFTRNYQTGLSLGLAIDRSRKRLDSIDDRTRFLAQEGQAPGFVRMFSQARTPDQPVRGGRKKIALIFVVLGLLIGLAVPVAVDVLDPRTFSPADATRVLGFAPMAWIADRKKFSEAFFKEQILRMAHRIDQDQTASGARIWCFTGAQTGAGTSTLVTGLGKALTDLGVSVLTIEANVRRSDVRYASGKTKGLNVLLQGQSSLMHEIVPADGEMSDRLPAGEDDGSGHLPDIHRLIDVLNEAAQIYSIVLVDLPPIVSSVDAEYLASRADAVVLVARARANSAQLKRAVSLLERNQPRAVAAVLNMVQFEESGDTVQREFFEFRDGAAPAPPRWRSPWLWR